MGGGAFSGKDPTKVDPFRQPTPRVYLAKKHWSLQTSPIA